MRLGLVILLVVLIGVAAWAGLFPQGAVKALSALPEAIVLPQAHPAPLFRWKDAQGHLVYGTEPPPGVKAERVEDKGTMSSVPATKIPDPPKKELPAGVTLQQLATERAIEQAAGAK